MTKSILLKYEQHNEAIIILNADTNEDASLSIFNKSSHIEFQLKA